uniref:CSON007756 protein n=1 Tax=Culicoides sonorensis TaxID=179676 RepID=A0A336MX39_CULSO
MYDITIIRHNMTKTKMFRILFTALLLVITEQIGEADYTLDDSFWNDDSPAGEVERLLKEYRQNQELVRRIGSHYYQIIYPVQLRHHEKMGISTREVGAQKFPQRGYDSNYPGGRGRSRVCKYSFIFYMPLLNTNTLYVVKK